jgi:hypothetical protein
MLFCKNEAQLFATQIFACLKENPGKHLIQLDKIPAL